MLIPFCSRTSMFLTVAWLRLFLFALLLFPGIYSREDTLCEFTRSLRLSRRH